MTFADEFSWETMYRRAFAGREIAHFSLTRRASRQGQLLLFVFFQRQRQAKGKH